MVPSEAAGADACAPSDKASMNPAAKITEYDLFMKVGFMGKVSAERILPFS